MLELKKQGKTRGVIVRGCLAERQKEQLLEDRPGIDHLVGVLRVKKSHASLIGLLVAWKSSGPFSNRLRFAPCRTAIASASRRDILRI